MRRGIFVLVSFILLILINFIYPITNETTNANSLLNTFSDNTTEKVIILPDHNISFELLVPLDTEVLNASIKLTLMDYNGQFPSKPSLTLGDPNNGWSKTLWAFKPTSFGALGHQQHFISGLTQTDITFQENQDNDALRLYLPASAEIYSASLNLTGLEYDHWSDNILELNRKSDSSGDYEPDMIVYKDLLYTAYRSYDPIVTNDTDSDIVINSTSNGINWTGTLEITPQPDSVAPYNDSTISADWRPTLEVFNNKLYCAWESNSTITTNDLDHDIILSSSTDGVTWSPSVVKVSDAWENDYSKNPGIKHDWGADLVMFKNQLWLVWSTNNTDSIGGFKPSIGDIMLSNSSDGITWSNATDLTTGDSWFINDYGPQLIVFNNSLYAVWTSNSSYFNQGDDNDYDIVYRNTSDGVNWSALKSINPFDNNPVSDKGTLDTQPTLCVYGNKLFCCWVSASTKYTEGTDRDIVLRYTVDGNFSEVDNVYEVTDANNEYIDHTPHLAIFNNRLYVIWVGDVYGNSEIFVKNFQIISGNGQLSTLQQVNPTDDGGDDYRPRLLGFKNKLYATWVSNDPKTSTGTDRDIILRNLMPSTLPINFGLNVGNDSFWEIAKGTQLLNTNTRFDLTTGFKSILSNDSWVMENSLNTIYGYNMVEVPLNANFTAPGMIRADGLDIFYNYSFNLMDFSDDLNYYITLNQQNATEDGIVIPFILTAGTQGKIKVSEINILLNYKPQIEITDIPPSGKLVNEPTYRIKWTDEDIDDNASISLYYDDNNVDYDGTQIISNISEDRPENFFDWVWWNAIPDGGSYYIYANISDGKNFHLNYSKGPLVLGDININNFINISILEPNGIDDDAWDVFDVTWTSYCPGEDAKITLFYDNDSVGFDGYAIDINNNGYFDSEDFVLEPPNDGISTYTWDISKLLAGEEYYIYAKITNHWNISFYNYSLGPLTRAHLPAPRDFTILGDSDPLDENLTVHNNKPRLSWSRPDTEITENLEYNITIWSGANKTGEIVYEITTVATEITILKELEFGNMYYAEIFARTPDARESVKSSIIFQIVNALPTSPIVVITPRNPNTNDNLLCSFINESYDPDNDVINYTYNWFLDGIQQFEYTNLRNIPALATSKDEHWKCVVTPFDGIDFGPSGSTEIIIRNSPPVLTILSPDPTNKYVDNKMIFFKINVTDPDSVDRNNLTYRIISDIEGEIQSGYVPSTRGVVEFTSELSKGTHRLLFNVSDGDSGVEDSIEITVKGHKEEGAESFVLLSFYLVVIIIVILIIIFLFLLLQVRGLRREGAKEGEEAEEEEEEAEEEVGEEEIGEEIPEPEELEEEELETEELTEEEPEVEEEPMEDSELDEELEDEEAMEE
jgi:hypothetical protein